VNDSSHFLLVLMIHFVPRVASMRFDVRGLNPIIMQNVPHLSASTRKKIQFQVGKNIPEQLQFIFGASVGVEAEQFLSVCKFDEVPPLIVVSILTLAANFYIIIVAYMLF
jgi:hypothetical protein